MYLAVEYAQLTDCAVPARSHRCCLLLHDGGYRTWNLGISETAPAGFYVKSMPNIFSGVESGLACGWCRKETYGSLALFVEYSISVPAGKTQTQKVLLIH